MVQGGTFEEYMNENEEKSFGYQFTAIPTNLMACMDLNCRSMLFTLIQLSSYYADKDGWFFRTNEDLRVECDLGEKVVRACLSTFHTIGLLEVKCIGKGRGKVPNYFKLNTNKFVEWESITLEDCIKNPKYKVETGDYRTKGWIASYLTENSPIEVHQSAQNADNIDNKENNNLSEDSFKVEVNNKSNTFEEYKKREDYLMNKLFHISTWIDFKTYRKQIEELISTALTEKVAEKTKERYKKIKDGKIKFLKAKICKEPYNSYYDDFYRKYDCGWLDKEDAKAKQNVVQSKKSNDMENEEAHKGVMRNFYERFGMDVPNEYKAKEVSKDKYAIKVPILNGDSNDDDLPF